MANFRHSLLLSSLLLAGVCVAQRASLNPATMAPSLASEDNLNNAAPLVRTGTGDRGGGDVVFYEDFANGLAGNNGVGPWTTAGPDGNIWKRSTTGPVGAYSNTSQRIGAPATFANGFMAFWSDSVNTDWTVTPPVAVVPPLVFDGALVSPVLNLSATPLVKIEYQQRLRWCCPAASPHALEVSTDGGATWTTSFPSAAGMSTSNDPGTILRSFVLTAAIAANPANVRFRFQHNPGASHYFWQIDDVRIIELYANDLKMDDGYVSHTNDAFQYGNIPPAQLNPTMLVGGNVTNRGTATQTNVTVTTTVRNSANAVAFTATASTPSLAPNATADISSTVTLPALPPDLYTATFVVSSSQAEELPADNTFLRGFRVTGLPQGYRYSIDGIGNHPPGMQSLASLGTNTFPGATDGVVFMSYYEVNNNPVMVWSIEVGLGVQTVAGGYVVLALRDTTAVFADPINLNQAIYESIPIGVTATHVSDGWIRHELNPPVVLPANNACFATASLYSNAGPATSGYWTT